MLKLTPVDRLPRSNEGVHSGRKKILVANVDDSFYAMDNTCPTWVVY